jgi:hypothetical protein
MTAAIPGEYVSRLGIIGFEFGDHLQNIVVNDARGNPLTPRNLIVAAG